MTTTLRDVTETTMHTVAGLVDEARGRIEDLPMPDMHHIAEVAAGLAQQSIRSRRIAVGAAVAVLVALALVFRRRRRHARASDGTPTVRPNLSMAGERNTADAAPSSLAVG